MIYDNHDEVDVTKAREIKNAKIKFISLVKNPANRKKFLIVKEKNIMSKNKNAMTFEELEEFINLCVSQAVTQTLEACGIVSQSSEAGGSAQAVTKQYDADGKHYLHDIII